ncbi:MAG TPA: pyridoxamine 5'-phosphate oxidase family protein [Candidatus Limnocylindrales bacterium]|nr:pyridoxamine 5'-phosphate oxidase family protein [Candidatus Limnocylindrales bacterium]
MPDATTAPASDLAAIAALLGRLDICMLTTRAEDGALHGRPMSNNGEVEYDGDSWFFAEDGSRKVIEIDADPRVELAFIDTAKATWINVEGDATIVRDEPDRKRALWKDDLERWFENGPDDPGVVLIKVSARHIDAWSRDGDRSFDV